MARPYVAVVLVPQCPGSIPATALPNRQFRIVSI